MPKVPSDFKMQPDEFQGLRAQVEDIKAGDVKLGRLLENLLLHLGHLHGFDPAQEDEKAQAQDSASSEAAAPGAETAPVQEGA